MTKLIIILLMLPLITFGQHVSVRKDLPAKKEQYSGQAKPIFHTELPIKTTTWNDVTKLADEITKLTKHPYKIQSFDTGMSYRKERDLEIKLASSDNDIILIRYQRWFAGANKDLEIAGTKTYNFLKISGSRYLDLFEVWRAFFEPEADVKNIVDMESSVIFLDDKIMKRAVFLKPRISDFWEINLWSE